MALHLRGPGTPGARLYSLETDLRAAAGAAGALLFANDRVDVTLVAGLDGVHLGKRSLLAGGGPAAPSQRHVGGRFGPRSRGRPGGG